jgi:ABC-2 type transport system permease protein
VLSPLIFWLLLGAGFGRSMQFGTQQHYLQYFFPGALIMIVLFTSIFTMMSVIEDRREGFLLAVLVAPIHPAAIVLGKVLGGATLATLQGLAFLIFAPIIGVGFGAVQLAAIVLIVFLVAFALSALGFCVAWRLDSAQAFHAIVNLFLIPLWLLSGAMFPLTGAAGWMKVIMQVNPLTYGVEGLRATLFPSTSVSVSPASGVAVLAIFSVGLMAAALVIVSRRKVFT